MSKDKLCAAACGDLTCILSGYQVVHLPPKCCITNAADLAEYEAAVARHDFLCKLVADFKSRRTAYHTKELLLQEPQLVPLTPAAFFGNLKQSRLAGLSTGDRALLLRVLGAVGDAEKHAQLPAVKAAMDVSPETSVRRHGTCLD